MSTLVVDHFAYDEDMIGKWVVIHCLACQYVQVSGESAIEVRDAAREQGLTDPIIFRVSGPHLHTHRSSAAPSGLQEGDKG